MYDLNALFLPQPEHQFGYHVIITNKIFGCCRDFIFNAIVFEMKQSLV